MNKNQKLYFYNALSHLYISPLEKCNLRCKICYTKKTSNILSDKEVLTFINRYAKHIQLKVITFCGGEVFTLPYFVNLINTLTNLGIFIQIITNGTVDKLNEINKPNSVNIIVSIDGLSKYHDKNRGKGNFKKSIEFFKKAINLGFHTEIFSIVTKNNFSTINKFENYIKKNVGKINITYHPRKPIAYLNLHPTNNFHETKNEFGFLSDRELISLMKTKNTFPPKNLGCYQISLASNRIVYGCCEGYLPIGTIKTPIHNLINTLKKYVESSCYNCYQPAFLCGLKNIIKKHE